jgi:hypothetical protein
VKRLADWIGGALSGVFVYRLLKRRREVESATAPASEETDDRAEELRSKLAESRATEEASPAEPEESAESLEERRRRVHEEGRAAIDRINDT